MATEAIQFGQRQRLTVQLNSLVRKYPRGVGIFKEFLQNADDGGASHVSMTLDKRSFSGANLPHPKLEELLGPALIVTNDKPFSDEDWEKIQDIGASGKIDDVTKTGRFGYGFNSVYNVTDYPMLLTAGRLAVFDPHEDIAADLRRSTGIAWEIEKLQRDESNVLDPFLAYSNPTTGLGARQTIFRLPLRNAEMAQRSSICNEAFTEHDFQQIVAGICECCSGLILFLSHVLSFKVSVIDEHGNLTSVLSATTSNRDVVEENRILIRSTASGTSESVLSLLEAFGDVETNYQHEIAVVSQAGSLTESWSVIRGLYSSENLIAAAREMNGIGEKAIPLAGAALQMGAPVESGILSCALPLPARSGIPIHVDGFFDLEDSRQDLHQDQTATSHSNKVRVNWNSTLIADGCATAAAALLQRIGEASGIPLYDHWPAVVGSPHRLIDALPVRIYEKLVRQTVITAGAEKTFCEPKFPVLCKNGLREPLLLCGLKIPAPVMPQHVLRGFEAAGCPISRLTPAALRQYLSEQQLEVAHYSDCELEGLRNRDWVIEIIKFCLSDKQSEHWDGAPLALMGDGVLRGFDTFDMEPVYIGSEAERSLLESLPSILLDADVSNLGVESLPNVQRIDVASVVANLPKMFASGGPTPSLKWLGEFFNYCAVASENSNVDSLPHSTTLQTTPLVFGADGLLYPMSSASTPVFAFDNQQQSWKQQFLDAIGCQFVSTAGEYGKAVARFKRNYGNAEIQSFDPKFVAEKLVQHGRDLTVWFVENPTAIDRVLEYVSTQQQSGLNSFLAAGLASLPIYPTVSGGRTAIAGGNVYLSSGFLPPSVDFDVNLVSATTDKLAKLYHSLGAKKLDEHAFLTDFALARFDTLSSDDQYSTLQWLRGAYFSIHGTLQPQGQQKLHTAVANAKIVRCTDGELRSPNQVYHPDCTDVAALLGEPGLCPDPDLFHDHGWMEMLATWGMARMVRANDILRLIDELTSAPLTGQTANRLHQIATAIEAHWDQLKDQTCQDGSFIEALSRREWLPAISSCPANLSPSLFAIPSKELFLPGEIVRHENFEHVSSALPACQFPMGQNLSNALGMRSVTVEEVLSQFQTVINAMAAGPSKKIAQLLRKIYQCLGSTILSDGFDYDGKELSERFGHQKCLVDNNDRTWAPNDCFSGNVHFFLGLRKRIYFANDSEDAFAEALGRKSSPDVEDFRRFFADVQRDQHLDSMNEAQIIYLREAYSRAADSCSPNGLSDCHVLTDNCQLASPAEILINDAPWISQRAKQAGVAFLDEELGGKVAMAFGVGQLSVVIEEQIKSFEQSEAEPFVGTCAQLINKIHSREFIEGICRLIAPTKQNEQIAIKLQAFQLQAASKIVTTLYWDRSLLENSDGETQFVFENGVLYVDQMRDAVLLRHIQSTIATQVLGDYEIEDASAISMMLAEEPGQIRSLLNELRIADLPEGQNFVPDTPPQSDSANETGSFDNLSAPPALSGNSGDHSDGLSQSLNNQIQGTDDLSALFENSSGSVRKPQPRSGPAANSNSSNSRTHRAVSYASGEFPSSIFLKSSDGNDKPLPVDDAAIAAVVGCEIEQKRSPTAIDRNKGFNIESRQLEGGEVERFIKVIALRGAWNDFGVKLSPKQLEIGAEQGDKHWLYVVEFADDSQCRQIHAIQNPIGLLTDFRLDAGWKKLSTEVYGAATITVDVGTRVKVAGEEAGEVVAIKPYGKFKKLHVRFDSGREEWIRYPDKSILIIQP